MIFGAMLGVVSVVEKYDDRRPPTKEASQGDRLSVPGPGAQALMPKSRKTNAGHKAHLAALRTLRDMFGHCKAPPCSFISELI